MTTGVNFSAVTTSLLNTEAAKISFGQRWQRLGFSKGTM